MSWDKKFMDVAKLIASWSKHPTIKVGCYIVDDDHNELSGGYNGLPRGIDDGKILDQSAPPRTHSITVHAEANAVAKAARKGHSLMGGTVYVTRPVCCQCAALLIQAGIKEIKMPHWQTAGSDWVGNCYSAYELLYEAGVFVLLTTDASGEEYPIP